MLVNKKEPLHESEIDFLIQLVQDNINEGDLYNGIIISKLKFMKEQIKDEEFMPTLTTAEDPYIKVTCNTAFLGQMQKKSRQE